MDVVINFTLDKQVNWDNLFEGVMLKFPDGAFAREPTALQPWTTEMFYSKLNQFQHEFLGKNLTIQLQILH